jgi:hypothetical protein
MLQADLVATDLEQIVPLLLCAGNAFQPFQTAAKKREPAAALGAGKSFAKLVNLLHSASGFL